MTPKDPTLVWALWISLGALGSLVGFGIRAILRGDLVPRKTLDDAYRDRDKWEAACQAKDELLDAQSARIEAGTEAVRVNSALLEALLSRGQAR